MGKDDINGDRKFALGGGTTANVDAGLCALLVEGVGPHDPMLHLDKGSLASPSVDEVVVCLEAHVLVGREVGEDLAHFATGSLSVPSQNLLVGVAASRHRLVRPTAGPLHMKAIVELQWGEWIWWVVSGGWW